MGIFRRKKNKQRANNEPSLAAEAGMEVAGEGAFWLIAAGVRKLLSAVAHALP
ncbi:hypothetical protein [Nocardia yamanashiensis]|uniref:hypothetical protein n=1 Tax=Nocardia yamanashiensis TaxID=209247 RepID=UPI000A603C89|nr:hypothetical protein [Nocardia yamanashiensis]